MGLTINMRLPDCQILCYEQENTLMALDLKVKDAKDTTQKERRSFLKKAVYVAPTLIAMGQLTKPTRANADFGSPPSDPGAGGGWG